MQLWISQNRIDFMLKIIFPLIVSINIAQAETLCAPIEETLFQCKLEKTIKSVSLCFRKDLKKVYYKFGTADKIELNLPGEKSGNAYLSSEQFGPSRFQWIKQIIFPVGRLEYVLSTPQGISVLLSVEGLKKNVIFSCDEGNSGSELSDAYELMKSIGYKEK
jgi:hypothetical protein